MSQRFDFIETPIEGLFHVMRKPLQDKRGSFLRFFCSNEFKEIGFEGTVPQMNYSITNKKGAIRGMHYQHPPHAEVKLVTCLRGKVFDVAIDIRKGSPTFLKWHGVILSEGVFNSLYIPEGFAHGFQALSDNCEMIYLHSNVYQPTSEGAVHALDKRICIEWPLGVTEQSDRDQSHPFIDAHFTGVDFK